MTGSTVLWLLWCAGLLVMTGWSVWRFQRGVRRLRSARRANCFLNDILAFSREQMRVRGPVILRVCRQATRPWVTGWVVPVIILPHELGPRLGSRHVRAVLMRQLAYIRQGLVWWRWVLRCVQVVYFFHPLVWWARHRFLRLMDECADQTVLTTMGDRMADYARMLEEIQRHDPSTGRARTFRVALPGLC